MRLLKTIILLFSLIYLSYAICPADLNSKIEQIISSIPRENIAIYIKHQNEKNDTLFDTLYTLNPDRYMIPASNNKLLTTSAAYLKFGGDSTLFRTNFYGTVDKGILKNLCVVGSGDPSITTAQWTNAISTIVQDHSIHFFDGDLHYDDTLFVERKKFSWAPQSWEWEDLDQDYGAAPSPFIVDENTFQFTVTAGNGIDVPPSVQFKNSLVSAIIKVKNLATTLSQNEESTLEAYFLPGDSNLYVSGGIPLRASQNFVRSIINPTDFVPNLLELQFLSRGVPHKGAIKQGKCTGDLTYFTNITSEPLSVLLNHTLLVSDNLYTEIFLKMLGLTLNKTDITFNQGLLQVRNLLVNSGKVNSSSFFQADGSGLSRHNLVSPQALVDLLELMSARTEYISFLPVAGKTGTLKNRFIGTPAEGIVSAKTGSMSGVNSISGYVFNKNYRELIFSILINNSDKPGSELTKVLDAIVVLLAELTNC